MNVQRDGALINVKQEFLVAATSSRMFVCQYADAFHPASNQKEAANHRIEGQSVYQFSETPVLLN